MKVMYQLSAILLSIILILNISTKTYGKRGCAFYGHSCYGGHGKRSEPQIFNGDNQNYLNSFSNDANNKKTRVDFEEPSNKEQDYYENREKELRYIIYNIIRQSIDNSQRNNQNNAGVPEKISTVN